jgi:prepilin-type N-terminal cleavage/methylation domain-containing protein/prepilin-type processing-associated H-X9-DG protein
MGKRIGKLRYCLPVCVLVVVLVGQNGRLVSLCSGRGLGLKKMSSADVAQGRFNLFGSGRLPLAFTLVELLVTIAIIGILVALLLPAVQAARESGRRSQCANNVKNIGLALIVYHDTYKAFPLGGWGHKWVGDPDRGTGLRQPGGWAYCVLPFVEEWNIHDLGVGQSGAAAVALYSQRLSTPLALFVCPTRRMCSPWPIVDQYSYMRTPKPYGDVMVVARADYAINGGTSNIISLSGPADLQQGDDPSYWDNGPVPTKFSGVSHLRTSTALKRILDGASKTYLIGEKHLPVDAYMTGTSPGDNESLYSGYCTDLHRFAGAIESLSIGQSPFVPPLSDNSTTGDSFPESVRFGSAHSAGFTMAFCDGSVQFLSYEIDSEAHFRFGHRNDLGNPIASLR